MTAGGTVPSVAGTEIVLFDFFGTLVEFEHDMGRLTYPDTYGYAEECGLGCGYDGFVERWRSVTDRLEVRAAADHLEFSLDEVAVAVAAELGVEVPAERCRELGQRFVGEWAVHVRPVDGVVEMLGRLAGDVRLGVVSNTSDWTLVPTMLDAMGVTELFDVIVLSIEHVYRKPHPSIYQRALDALRSDSERVAFVGDTYEADYVGPRAVGLDAYLIDPAGRHDVPDEHRLTTVLDIESKV